MISLKASFLLLLSGLVLAVPAESSPRVTREIANAECKAGDTECKQRILEELLKQIKENERKWKERPEPTPAPPLVLEPPPAPFPSEEAEGQEMEPQEESGLCRLWLNQCRLGNRYYCRFYRERCGQR